MLFHTKKDNKFIIILSVFVAAALTIITGISYFVIRNTGNTAMQKAASKAEYFMRINDSRMETANNILAAMQNDSDVLKYVTLNDRFNILAINKKLQFFTAVENMFNFRLEVIDPKNKIYVSSQTVKYRYTNIENFNNNEGIIKHDDHVNVYFKRTYFEGSELIFSYKLFNDISTFVSEDSSEHYLTLYDGEVIYGNQKHAPSPHEINALGTKKGNNIIYSIASSHNPVFSYVYVLEKYIPPFTIVQITALSILILCLAYILAVLFYNMSQKRIADIASKVRQLTDITIDENDTDIDLIIDKIKNTFDTLKEAQQTNIDNQPIILQKQLSDLYNRILPEYSLNKLLYDELNIITKKHTLISIIIVNAPELEDEYTVDGILYIKKDIIDMICERLTNVYYFADRVNGFTLITVENDKKIVSVINSLAEVLLINFNIILKACVGQSVCGYNESIKSYNNIQNLISNILFRESDTVILTESEISLEHYSCIYSIEIEQQIIDRFVEEQFESAKTILESVIVENITPMSTKNALYILKNAFDITISRIGERLNINVNSIIKNDIPFDNMSVEQIKIEFMKPFNALIEYVQNIDSPSENDYMRIYNFISNNIHNDVNLNDLSDYLGYSVWKTSRKFKELFNENFKAYVITRKIEISKELLMQDYSVVEVATAIGCNSAATFIRMFKNSVGITPGEYKRSLTAEETNT